MSTKKHQSRPFLVICYFWAVLRSIQDSSAANESKKDLTILYKLCFSKWSVHLQGAHIEVSRIKIPQSGICRTYGMWHCCKWYFESFVQGKAEQQDNLCGHMGTCEWKLWSLVSGLLIMISSNFYLLKYYLFIPLVPWGGGFHSIRNLLISA